MKLTYLTSIGRPGKMVEDLFDDVRIIHASPDDQEDRVQSTEEEMSKQGSEPFDMDDFLLYTPEVSLLGEVIERNRFNSGMECDRGNLVLGNTRVHLHHALKLPFDGDPRVLIVAPHYEEDYAMVVSYAYAGSGSGKAHVLFATLPPEGKHELALGIYHDIFGLSDSDYDFAMIDDRKVHENKGRFQQKLDEVMNKVRPRNVILPSDGRNSDHKNVLKLSLPVVGKTDANIVLAKSVQSFTKATHEHGIDPSLWHVYDSDVKEVFLRHLFSNTEFGPKEYVSRISNIISELPEPLSRYVAKTGADDVMAQGFTPLRMDHKYAFPHDAYIF